MNRILSLLLLAALTAPVLTPSAGAAKTPRGLSKPTEEATALPESMPPPPAPPPATTPPPPTTPDPANTPPVTEGTLIRWFGHAFVFLTSPGGVRIAINPFSEGSVGYRIPDNLPAEIVLISSEASDHSGGQHIFGIPQIFRSLAGVGANRANGIPFRGINTWRDAEGGKKLGRNTVYVVEVDGLRFCHLGTLGHPLGSRDVAAIGQVDVLFLPVGTLDLSVREILRNADVLGAKWIIPITYQTSKNSILPLRPLSAVDFGTRTIVRADSAEYRFSTKALPAQPTVLLLREP